MTFFDVQISRRDLDMADRFLDALGPAARSAVARSINRAVTGVRTDAVKEVRQVYNVKAGDVRKTFTIRRASNRVLAGVAGSSGRRLSLSAFGIRPRTASRKRMPAKGVSAEVRKGRRKVYPGTFVGRGRRSGKLLVFKRKGASRLPVAAQTRLSVPQMIGNENVESKIRENATLRFRRTLAHEIDFTMKKLGAR
jgi:hypothetical protein